MANRSREEPKRTTHSRRPRRVWASLVACLAALCLAIYGAMVWMVTDTFANRVFVGIDLTPESFGLQAETVSLTSSDGIGLKAWWVLPDSAPLGTVVLLHGMDWAGASGMLGHARFFRDAGYASLALDMRAHGRSEGNRIGLAFEEPRDVSAAIDWVLAQESVNKGPIILLGVSLGGAVALRTAAARPEVDAVISEGSYASVDRMVTGFMETMGIPRALATVLNPFARLALATVYGVWPATASPVHDFGAIAPRPVLLMHGEYDEMISLDHLEALQAAAGAGTEAWLVPGAGHVVFRDLDLGPRDETYKERLLEFLARVEIVSRLPGKSSLPS